MKKSVIILLAIIYIASIALVSFFGLKFKVFEEIVYVERIELLNEGLEDTGSDEFGKYAIVHPDENGEWRYQIKYRVHPDEATNSEVEFSYDTQNTAVTVDENGVVTFTEPAAVTITITPKDGTDSKAIITIIATPE